MEVELQDYLDSYESTHDYDEYHFDLDSIEHDPYVLISILSVLHEGAWTVDEVQGTLETLFDRQYILTEDVVVEVRYRTESRTDSEGNSYTVEVPYNYYICYVTLENPQPVPSAPGNDERGADVPVLPLYVHPGEPA